MIDGWGECEDIIVIYWQQNAVCNQIYFLFLKYHIFYLAFLILTQRLQVMKLDKKIVLCMPEMFEPKALLYVFIDNI